jgi:hypothetical protein
VSPLLIALAKIVGLVVTPVTWSCATKSASLPEVSRSRLRSSSQIDTPAALSAAKGSVIPVLVSVVERVRQPGDWLSGRVLTATSPRFAPAVPGRVSVLAGR